MEQQDPMNKTSSVKKSIRTVIILSVLNPLFWYVFPFGSIVTIVVGGIIIFISLRILRDIRSNPKEHTGKWIVIIAFALGIIEIVFLLPQLGYILFGLLFLRYGSIN